MPEAWTRVVLRHRLVVLAAWSVLAVVGIACAARLAPLLTASFAVPGTDSAHGEAILTRDFGEATDGTFIVVFPVAHPSDRSVVSAVERRLARIRAAVPEARVSAARHGGGILFADVATPLDLQHAKRLTQRIRAAAPGALVTGQPAVQHDLDPVLASDLRRGEALALPIALLVLLLVFGWSRAVLVPFVVAAATIATTLGVLYAAAHAVAMVAYVTNLVALIGLGLALDYSLLVVTRFREELAHADVETAVARTIATAGRTVVASGAAVAIGLALLLVVPVPFIRSLGIAGLAVPLVSIAATLTLQPVLLTFVRPVPRGSSPRWETFARAVLRRRALLATLGAALLVVLALPVVRLHVTSASIEGIPSSLESARGYRLLREGVGAGAVAPTQIVVPGRNVERLTGVLAEDREVQLVASGSNPPYVAGGYARVYVAGRHPYGAPETRALIGRIRGELPPGAHVGGAAAQTVDFLDRTYGAFPWLVAAVLALTFLLLLRAFRSLLVPLKAVALNALTILAVYGLLALLFAGPVDGWVPVFLFALLFGLSMDYEVFLVSRIREAHDAGESADDAIAHGLARTGGVITAAAAVLAVAVGGLAVGRAEALREFGVGLVLAVLLDATIVRLVLVPAVLGLLGERAWWPWGRRPPS